MNVFEIMRDCEHEQLVVCQEETSGLKALIAIHDTTLGPALGGTRMWTYDCEEDAIEDVLRLSRGMTYKAAAAGLNLGGGKGVIIGNPKKDKSEAMWRAYGRYVQSLGGRYITAEDVGVDDKDLEIVSQETRYAVGLPGKSGDPSPATAYGCFYGMRAVAEKLWGDASLKGRTISVQGVGSVGYHLCKLLSDEGSQLIITDIDEEAIEQVTNECEVTVVDTKDIYRQEADIFVPCALGAILNDETIPQLSVKAVAGAANNQLAEEDKHAKMLEEKGILYAPDYVLNAGGVTNVSEELIGYNKERAYRQIAKIYDNIHHVFQVAERDNIPTHQAANRLAEERIEAIRKVRSNYVIL